MDKYKQYIDVKWWHNVEKRDIENWIRNFGENKRLAEIILDNVIFYNTYQLKAYTRFLVNKLKEQVFMLTMRENNYLYIDDNVLVAKWNDYISKTNFLPAALQTDPTSSAHKIIGYWRSVLEYGETPFSNIIDIDKNYKNGIRRFVLLDDFSGTGEQILSVLKQKILFDNKQIEVGELPDIVSDIEIIITVYVMHEKAKNKLTYEYSKIKFIYVDLVSDDLNYLNEESFIYEKVEIDKKKDIIKEILEFNNSIVANNKELQKLSSYTLNIPIVFEHGCPNNTLLLLFAHSNNWQQLFKRGNET